MITMQMPGIFTVTGHSGGTLDIVSDDGVRLRVTEASLRRMNGEAAPVPDPTEDA